MSAKQAKQNYGRFNSSLITLMSVLIILAAVAAIAFMLHGIILPSGRPSPSTTIPVSGIDTPVTTNPSTEQKPADTTAAGNESTTVSDTTVPPAADTTTVPDTTEPPAPVIILPETEPADSSYFETCLFIGDSRTQGMMIATGGYGARYYADRGLSIKDLSKKKLLSETAADGTTTELTILESLTKNPTKEKIYIWLGLNELGWNSSDVFLRTYRNELAALREACPEAQICIMSVLPVARNAVVIGQPTSAAANERVREHNSLLLALAEEAGVYYLNCYEAFVDDEGYLPDSYASDGIHLLREQNLNLCSYILAHPIPVN